MLSFLYCFVVKDKLIPPVDLSKTLVLSSPMPISTVLQQYKNEKLPSLCIYVKIHHVETV